MKRRVVGLRRHSRAVEMSALVVLLIAGFGAYKAYDYTEHDPRFCLSCHIMHEAWDRWNTSEHRKVNCHECHQQSKLESMRQLWLTVTRRPTRVEKHAHVPPERCARCHRSGENRWKQIARTAGHEVHAVKRSIPCVRCHAKSLHRFRPPAELCRECHARESIQIAGMGTLHCTNCHNFLAEQSGLLPTRSDCLWCHEQHLAPRRGITNATTIRFDASSPMQFPCSDCHNPHNRLPATGTCQTCHPRVYAGRERLPAEHQNCVSCHKPHTWRISSRAICANCHGTGDKLPSAWVHANGHRILACQDCHRPHLWRVDQEKLCSQCHLRAG